MEYTVQKLADLAGVSPRTLRYYDQIGLLSPCRVSSSGYRIYGPAEVDRLQQILFYRALGMHLNEIRRLADASAGDSMTALQQYRAQLQERQERLALLIRTVDQTIQARKGERNMSDTEKFQGLKNQLVGENERQYGGELREKYGAEAVVKYNRQFLNLSEEAFQEMQDTQRRLQTLLEQAVLSGENPAGAAGRSIAVLHRKWLSFTWPHYTTQAHAGLVRMYTEDQRFTQYYDSAVPGCAAFLAHAVTAWLNAKA